MKPVKSFVLAALLVLSLSLSTFAGDIDQPGGPAPEPPSPPRMTTTDESPDTTGTPMTTDETTDYYRYFEVLKALLSVY